MLIRSHIAAQNAAILGIKENVFGGSQQVLHIILGPVFLTYLVQSVSCDLAVQRPYHGRAPSPFVEGEKLFFRQERVPAQFCLCIRRRGGREEY